MLRYIGRRIFIAIPTLIIVSILVFALQKLLPGDPVLTMAGEERDPQVLEYLRERYRLNDPIPVQYFAWIGAALTGNLGISLRTDIPVLELILSKLPVTIELAILAMIVALAIGIPAGIISAVRKGTTIDYAANVVALSGLSIPNFWLGIMLIMLISVRWQLLPASGFVPPGEDLWLNIKTMLMPAFVLGTGLAASLMRHTRSAMLGVLRSDYIRTARAKGLEEWVVLVKHALRAALIPIVMPRSISSSAKSRTLPCGPVLPDATPSIASPSAVFPLPRCPIRQTFRIDSGSMAIVSSSLELHPADRSLRRPGRLA